MRPGERGRWVRERQCGFQALEQQQEEELTEEILAEILEAAKGSYYAALSEAGVRTFVGLGLCLSKRLVPGWLSCRYCRTNRRKTYCFQGSDQVREHFMNHALGGSGRAERGSASASTAAEAFATQKQLQEAPIQWNSWATVISFCQCQTPCAIGWTRVLE